MSPPPSMAKSAGDRSRENGEKSCAFDQRIAGGQLLAGQAVGQNSVFDRSEQGAERAKQKQRDKQQFERGKPEAGDRCAGSSDFDELQTSCDHRFIEFVGELAAERRKDEMGSHQRDARQRHKRSAAFAANLEQNEKHQRVLEKIIVEGGKKLAPE